MFVEALRHAFIRCPRHLKDLGVLYDLIALQARSRRLRQAWHSHIQKTHDAIASLVLPVSQDTPLTSRRSCAVLGSGLLLEVPIEALSARYTQVFCVDLFHMPEVHRRCASLANVALIEADLTGCLAHLPDLARDHKIDLPVPEPWMPDADVIISVNVLSQLSFRLLRWASQFDTWRTDRLVTWEHALQTAHVTALVQHPDAVLITDYQRIVRDPRTGVDQLCIKLLGEGILPPSILGRTWEWSFAPAPEEHRHLDVVHMMCAGRISQSISSSVI